MTRVIKFRGQDANGFWHYGYFSKDYLGICYITTLDGVDTSIVIESTLGQFTGRTDSAGNELYEGDLVKWTNGKHYWEAVISTIPNCKTNTLYAVETHHNLSTYFNEFDEEIYNFERSSDRKGIRNELEYLSRTVLIIGNIHEKGAQDA